MKIQEVCFEEPFLCLSQMLNVFGSAPELPPSYEATTLSFSGIWTERNIKFFTAIHKVITLWYSISVLEEGSKGGRGHYLLIQAVDLATDLKIWKRFENTFLFPAIKEILSFLGIEIRLLHTLHHLSSIGDRLSGRRDRNCNLRDFRF